MLDAKGLDRLAQISEELGLDDELERLAELLNNQSKEGQDLIFNLLRNFEVCRIDRYLSKSEELAGKISRLISGKAKRVVLMPLSDFKSNGSRSGDCVSWMIKRYIKDFSREMGIGFSEISRNIEIFDFSKSNEDAFILVDDFIGTGGTAKKAIDRLIGLGVSGDNIYVGSFVGMYAAKKLVCQMGVSWLSLKFIGKGITDSKDIHDKAGALNIMREMEVVNGVSESYRFGYGSSEALAVMCFCPNNTFPVFWWPSTRSKWPAVFVR